MTWSDDRGRSWHEPIEPFVCPNLDNRPGSLRFACITELSEDCLLASVCWVDHSNPVAPYFNERTEGLLDTRILLSVSEDAGQTWSPLRPMDTSPFDMPTPLTGPIQRLQNGELACQFELNKPYEDTTPWHHASVLLYSSDGGWTWPRHTIVTQDPENRVFYWDQRLSVLPDGRLFDVFWTFDRKTAEYLNIHGRVSSDAGHSWSALWDTGVPGQPGPVFKLGNGALAMPYVERAAVPTMSMCHS